MRMYKIGFKSYQICFIMQGNIPKTMVILTKFCEAFLYKKYSYNHFKKVKALG